MKLVFIDPKCPTPYQSDTLRSQGLGGTEGTVVRIAQGLSRQHQVLVLQHNRHTTLNESRRLTFAPISTLLEAVRGADHVFFVQKAQHLATVAQHSHARLWVWLHNYLHDEVPYFWRDHLRHRLGIVCVSQSHAAHTHAYLRQHWANRVSLGWLGRGGLAYLHNPVNENLAPDASVPHQRHKLVFFSSPYKGLEQVLPLFHQARAQLPGLQLFVADPGYVRNFDDNTLNAPGIVRLGSLAQPELLRHVREALCVFYPQQKRPETFGLVYAEANAVGTPVLAHRFGSAQEVLCDSNPPLDASQPGLVLATLKQWVEEGAPATQVRPEFQRDWVLARWQAFLQDSQAFCRAQAQDIKRLSHLSDVSDASHV